jgi:transposase
VTRKTFEARIWELVTGHTMLERIAEAMLSARATLKAQYEKLHKAVVAIVREDVVCRRLITVPGVGPVVAVTFKSAVDDPTTSARSTLFTEPIAAATKPQRGRHSSRLHAAILAKFW